jgi:hypothetical protein
MLKLQFLRAIKQADHIQAELKRPKSLNIGLQRKYLTFTLQDASGRTWKAQPVKYPRWEVSVVR